MLRSLYSGVSGMRGFQTKLDVIGNNIANVNTVGFKAGRVMFKDILSQTVAGVTPSVDGTNGGVNAKQIGLGVSISAIDTIHTPGSAMTTNVVTDLRIDGDGFFMVSATPGTGEPLLTRAGNFTVDANNQLVTSDGMYALDSNGAIIDLDNLGANGAVTAFSISNTGEFITVDSTGATNNSGIFVGVAKISNPSGLEKIGGNLYRQSPNSDDIANFVTARFPLVASDPATGTGAIVSGQLEMSNVDLTAEFTEMIVAQRGFQANSRIITTSDEILQEVVNLKH
jgi:flagellar hook protein FlgE